MKVVGIIIESNPFHNGHKYLIDQVKKQLNPDILIALSSGYFTMRGEISLLSKKEKTKLLLEAGFDLVIDYPLYLLLNSSDYFGKNGVDILSKCNITHLAFGIEADNIEQLITVSNLMDTDKFKTTLVNNLKKQISYKKAIQNTIISLTNLDSSTIDMLMHSNNTLAFGYLNAIKKYNIKPFGLKRIGNLEENNSLDSFPSGTALRESFLKNDDISKYLPYNQNSFSSFKNYNIKFQTLVENLFLDSPNKYSKYLHITEGIENYIFKNYNSNFTINENIQSLANKKYSKSRIRRTILSMILQIPSNIDFNQNEIRILGFNKNGESY